MARCPGTDCSGFDGKGAVWFKIAQYGLTPEAMNLRGPWHQASMLTGENATGWPVTIPRDLVKGAYLIRHEVINLQSAKDYGPQFYVECAQLRVIGNGDHFPSAEYMASFPGTYNYSGQHSFSSVLRFLNGLLIVQQILALLSLAWKFQMVICCLNIIRQ
jgi:lytic cellulose monooxygenase (C1-hydroxylating)